ncbi:MAG: PQQ-binding-like beta-propeller repeat protein [Pirellulales bacterium]
MIHPSVLLMSFLVVAQQGWPQFHGPRRDNKSEDMGLLKQWPEGGPKLLWRADGIGHGFASVAIGRDRIYTAGNLGDATVITALDLGGKQVWQAKNGSAYEKSYPGSRGTPTLDGNRLYHLSGEGDIVCLDVAAGKPLWSLNMGRRFGGRVTMWGLAESLLVDGDRLICSPGGKEIAMAAVDKQTGRTIWTCRGAGDPPGYASPILVEYAGLRQFITMTAQSVIGVAADSGKLLWRYEREAPFDVNAATPVYHDGCVAVFTTWGRGATLLRLKVRGQACDVERVWHSTDMDSEHGGVVLVDGFIYGHADGNHQKRHWACVDWATGKTQYLVDAFPGRTGAITFADGMLYLVGEERDVALQRPSPAGFEVVSRFTLPKGGEGPVWAHPVVCGGRLYIRHGGVLYAYDVRGPQPK